MKNKKILLLGFLFVLLVQVILGLNKYNDILQSGKLVKIKCGNIADINKYNYKKSRIYVFTTGLSSPFKNDIDFLKEEIAKEKKRKFSPAFVYDLGKLGRFFLNLECNKDGFLKVVSYAKKMSDCDIYLKTTLSSCRIAGYKDKKEIDLEVPILGFNFESIMSYSEKQLKKIAGYVNKIPRDKRDCVGVFRYKDGVFLPVDLIVNGKSLNEIAGKK